MEPAQRSQRTHLDVAIAQRARTQHGVFTRQQARDAGLSTSAISRRLRGGIWAVVDTGVYRLSGTPESWQQRLMAACLDGPAVASHRSAGALWRLPTMPEDVVEVTALRHRRRRRTDVVWHESYHLTPRDVTEMDGIPVTRPVRTFLDLGVVLAAEELEQVLNEGIRRNLVSVGAIGRRLDELGPLRRGTATVRKVLGRHVRGQRPPESVLETRFLQLLRSAGLPEPVAQHEVRIGSDFVARIDFAYPERRIAIELDGAAYHSGALADRRDRRRENRLAAAGWRVLRFDWDEVTQRPDYVLEMLRASA